MGSAREGRCSVMGYSARMPLPSRIASWRPVLVMLASACAAIAVACGDDAAMDDDASAACPALTEPLANPGDVIDETYAGFARGFFDDYCVRCHSSSNTTNSSRQGAPEGFNWDQEASVREHLDEIRHAVGVTNFMPFSAPFPSCDDRARLVRWIDADAP